MLISIDFKYAPHEIQFRHFNIAHYLMKKNIKYTTTIASISGVWHSSQTIAIASLKRRLSVLPSTMLISVGFAEDFTSLVAC